MELPVELCEEITGICNFPRVAESADGDRRAYRRFPFGCRGTIWSLRKGVEGPATPVLLRDISVGGVSFLHAEAIKIGGEFIIGFVGQHGQLVRIQCEANRCESGGTGGTQFVIGASFQALLQSANDAPAQQPTVAAAPAPQQERPVSERIFKRETIFTQAQAPIVAAPQPPVPVVAPQPAPPVEPAPAVAIPIPAPVAEEILAPFPTPIPEPIAPSQPEPIVASPQTPKETPMSPQAPEAPPAIHLDPAYAAKNQEVLARVKALYVKQHQSLQTQLHSLEENNQRLTGQAAALADLTRQVEEFKSRLAQSDQLLNEERQKSARNAEAIQGELVALRETVKILQAKSDADDKAIAELAGFFSAQTEANAQPNAPAIPVNQAA
ncbi:MAG: hypothetical protein ABSG31_05285 [Tepidisphaeraceae bacterium]